MVLHFRVCVFLGQVVISIKIDWVIMAQRDRNQLRKKIENYSYGLNDHLDLGHKSNTFKGINEKSGELVAIKVVDLRAKDRENDQLNTEIEVLKKMQHPNLIHCHDVYSTVNNCYIITEFCDQGDLENRITTRGKLVESEALVYFKDTLSGFLFMAGEKYIHGGLKPSCLFLRENVVKLGGFSNARKMKDKQQRKQVKFNLYQSPESAKENLFNHKSDIWSLGMILYVLLHGALPWEFQDKGGLLEKVGKPYHINKQLSENTKDFLKRTLTARENRLGLQELIAHPLVLQLSVNKVSGPYTDRRELNVSRVQRQFNAQVNWMRFLLRLIERILNYPEQLNTLVLKFIMTRQLAVQFQELRRSVEKAENPFGIASWSDFLREKEKGRKYKQVLSKYQSRYDKTLGSYRKFMQKVSGSSSLGYLTPILNDNFVLSEYNSMVAIRASLEEMRKLWGRITKEYPPKGKYERDSPFRFRAELLLLDFLMTYYQLNCMLVDDFNRPDSFEKNSKLDLILDYQPVDLDASHLEEIEHKLIQLAIVPL